MNNKIYIGLITSAGNAHLFDWYNEAAQYVDGLAVVWHGEKDAGFETLERNKGNGFIVQREYYGHHGHSMNDWLLNPKIRPGDWCIILDSTERLNIDFARQLRNFTNFLETNGINSLYHYSKLALFRKFEGQFFMSTPHWGLYGAMDHKASLEQIEQFTNPKSCLYSVRNETRPQDHFIDHFVKYYLIDSSNHLLLGRENNHQEFQTHEQVRLKFKEHLQNDLKIPLIVEKLLAYFQQTPDLPYLTKWYLNFEPILNDFYCYRILNHPIEQIIERRNKKELFSI